MEDHKIDTELVSSVIAKLKHGQWHLSLAPDGATEPWSIFGGKRKKH